MKSLLISLCFTAWFSITASADWGPVPLKSLVEHSNCIVVAEFESEVSKSGSPERTDQTATLKVISVIKGEAPETIVVTGYVDTRLCKAQYVFPATKDTRYLLFLYKSENTYSVMNGIFGALTIVDNKVIWFSDETKMETMAERKPIELDTAIRAIRAVDRELAKNMAPEKAVEVLLKQIGFGFGAPDGALELESDIAFKLLTANPKAKEHFQSLFEKGGTASKLFALCAIHRLDSKAFDKLSRSMDQDEVIGTHFGCCFGESKVSEIIQEISKGSYESEFTASQPEDLGKGK
jgi:hypothetical protein